MVSRLAAHVSRADVTSVRYSDMLLNAYDFRSITFCTLKKERSRKPHEAERKCTVPALYHRFTSHPHSARSVPC